MGASAEVKYFPLELSPVTRPNQKRTDLQCLRALAIVAVLAFHLRPQWCELGFLGVDVFFVLSGFLMTVLLTKTPAPPFGETLVNFYTRRVKRIFPVYLAVLLISLILATFIFFVDDFEEMREKALWALAFATNWRSWWLEGDYFQELAAHNPFTHTWSLAVEVQFYFAAPFLLTAIARLPRPLPVVYGLILASLSLQLSLVSPTLQFSFVASRLWQFLTGTAAFFHAQNVSKTTQSGWISSLSIAAWTLLTALVLLLPHFHYNSLFFIPLVRVVATALTGGIVFFGTAVSAPAFDLNRHSQFVLDVFTYVGDISYSLYLVHWPVIVFAKYLGVFESTPLLLWIVAILAVTLLEYHFFETRILRLRSESQLKLVAALYVLAILGALMLPGLRVFSFPDKTSSASAYNSSTEVLHVCEGDLRLLRKCPSIPNFPFRSKVAGEPYVCMFKGKGEGTIFLTGNSFAMRYAGELSRSLAPHFSRLYVVAESVCVNFPDGFNEEKYHCRDLERMTTEMAKFLRPKVILVSQRLIYAAPIMGVSVEAKVMQKLAQFWRTLSLWTPKIIVIEPNGAFDLTRDEFVNLIPAHTQTFSRKEVEKELTPSWYRVVESLKKCPKCVVFPVQPYYCRDQTCNIFDPLSNVTLFCDPSHVSPAFVSKLSGDLAAEIPSGTV